MTYLVFLFVLWTAAMFHLWEHRQMEKSLAAITTEMRGKTLNDTEMKDFLYRHDWRIVSCAENGILLRRAFNPCGKNDVFRYAAPLLLLVVTLLALKSPLIGFLYLGLLAGRWFLAAILLMPDETPSCYSFVFFGKTLFSESLRRS